MDKSLYDELFEIKDTNAVKSLTAAVCPRLYLLEVNANRKVYRTGFLKKSGFRFPEGVKWEDIRPHIQLVHLAKSCVALPDTGFIYRRNSAGQITAGTGAGRLDILKVFDEVMESIGSDSYEKRELAAVMEMICNYTFWMIEMTNTEYIDLLLEGLHQFFRNVPDEMTACCSAESPEEQKGKNKCIGLINCLREGNFRQLAYYDDRRNMYRYWSENGGKRKNIVTGGIQCIRDSGLRYTVRLLFKKIFYMGFQK